MALITLALLGAVSSAWSEDGVRKPVWAGKFYPADKQVLLSTIENLTQQAAQEASRNVPPDRTLKALILPHAGYRYSGLTAAHSGYVLKGRTYNKVLLLGPDHRVGFKNGAYSDAHWWETPLGKIALHKKGQKRLQSNPLFHYVAASEKSEHSLEVLLPFLQVYLFDFKIVPMVIGPCDHSRMALAIEPLLDRQTLLVVSADLSHYLPYEKAVKRDHSTIGHILDLNVTPILSDRNRSCGKHPIGVLINLARNHNWQPVLLNYSNSGDTAGDKQQVVGYAAIAFYGEKFMPSSDKATSGLTKDQGLVLVALARQTLMERFKLEIPAEQKRGLEEQLKDEAFQARNGTFVTLKIGGRLRGCIGSLVGREPLVQGVRTNAINAAFHDPRFQPLTPKEFDQVIIEVSVLTDPKPLSYDNASDLIKKLQPNIDGVIIRKGFASATFLPQVWDQLPKAEVFLSHLCMKAGIQGDAWKQGDLEVETYQVQYFEESH